MNSEINPFAASLFVLLALLTMTLPRRWALVPMWTLICLMPMGQEFVVLNLHFMLFRVLLLLATIRVLVRGEASDLAWTKLDTVLVLWAFVAVPLGALADSPTELLGNRLGDSYNAALMYFIVRCTVRDLKDVWRNVSTLACLSLPVASLMLNEKLTGHNLLSVFGGVPEITQVRNGELRCQGAFRHPLLAGAFGATQFPLFFAMLWAGGGRRALAWVGMVAALVIVVAASSSGALLALVCALLALCAWALRNRMRSIRWLILWTVLALALVMNAPVWYLFARMSDVVGGGGWHRAWLIDQAVSHFNEWWLFGTTYTAHWGPSGDVIAEDPRMMDITNHYIMEGVRGGVLRLVLFVAMLAIAFGAVGRFVKAHAADPMREKFVVWALGVSLFAHCVTFLSVNYFDQSILILFWLLATLASLAEAEVRPAPRPAPVIRRTYSFEGSDS